MTATEGLRYYCAFCPWQGSSGLMDHVVAKHPTMTGTRIVQRIRERDEMMRPCADGSFVHDFKGQTSCPECGWDGKGEKG